MDFCIISMVYWMMLPRVFFEMCRVEKKSEVS